MNKLNKLVETTFNTSVTDEWLSEEFQKKLKKVFKTKKEKPVEKLTDGKPKQHTPYIQFCMDERPEVKKENPTMSAKEITAKLGEKWNIYKSEKPEVLQKKYGYVPKV